MLKTIQTSVLVFVISTHAFAEGLQCVSLFEKAPPAIQVDQPTLGRFARSADSKTMMFLVENQIKQFAQDEMAKMSPEELYALRAEAHKIGSRMFGVEARNNFYKAANGSLRSRVIIEEANKIRRVRNEVKRGSIDQAVEGMQVDFVQFEVNFLFIESLHEELNYLYEKNQENTATFKDRRDKLQAAEKYFGKNFYRYQAMQNMFVELKTGPLSEQRTYARQTLQRLQEKTKIEASKQILKFRKIALSEVEKYADFSNVAKDAMARKVARVEFWTMLKMITLSGPIMTLVQKLIYKLPESALDARENVSAAFGISYNQHLRELYLEPIESILALSGKPADQYELLKSLNPISEKPDQLMVIFARVPENEKDWIDIKNYAASIAGRDNAFATDFYNRMIEAEKKAIKMGAFPLYYHEAGVTIAGKLAMGAATGYYFIHKYLEANPDAAGSLLTIGHHVLQMIAGF